MALGFRKSLFGFKQSDVVEFIEKSQKEFKTKSDELSEKLNKSQNDYEELLNQKNELSRQLDEFKEKNDEIETLSQKIGKLYLISQTNAKAIMANANENNDLIETEVEKNLSAIDEAHISLNELRQNIYETSNNFIGEIDKLLDSLEVTRDKINGNNVGNAEATENFQLAYQNITQE